MPDPVQDDLTAALGGQIVRVLRIDGGSESVRVRQLPVKLWPVYLSNIDDEIRQVALFCEKDDAWVEELTPSSFEEIIKIGEKLNLDFLARFAERQIARNTKIAPQLTSQILARVADATQQAVRAKLESQSGDG